MAWAGAAGLHGALLAALIFGWPAKLAPPPPEETLISLMIVKAGGGTTGSQNPVQPKPPSEKRVVPPTPPVRVEASTPLERPRPARPVSTTLSHLTATKTAAPSAVEANQNALEVPQRDSVVIAAKPVGGNANQPPDYPEEAQLHGEQGKVFLSIHVLPDGTADRVQIMRGSGFNLLDQAAINAVLKWRFQPAVQSGQPVASEVPYWIYFKLVN